MRKEMTKAGADGTGHDEGRRAQAITDDFAASHVNGYTGTSFEDIVTIHLRRLTW